MNKEELREGRQMKKAECVRQEIFGIEDGIVSTLGALTGIAAGSQSQFIVVLSGLVIVSVEAISMAAGSYLSSKSAFAVMACGGKHKFNEHRAGCFSERNAFLMGCAYVVGGAIPLFPYLVLDIDRALPLAVALSITGLFIVGAVTSRVTKRVWWRSGLETVIVSIGAAIIGYGVGYLVRTKLGVTV